MTFRFAVPRLPVLVLVASLVVPSISSAQANPQAPPPARPARDAAPPAMNTGTGVIRGRVVAADGGRPLRRVQIRCTAPELGGPGATTSTDEDGGYEIPNLPAGRYTITATRAGFLPLRFGQKRPREPGKLVELRDGQTMDAIDVALPRMSVIAGRITDEDGEPVSGVRVMAMRSRYLAGRRQLVVASEVMNQTDDVGEYRIGGLVPGTYVVTAQIGDKWIVDAGGREQTMGYAPTYFPGTTSIAEARRVTVGLGEEATATDFALIPGRAATVSGTALDSKGQPFPMVVLGVEIRSERGGFFGGAGNTRTGPDGTFTLRDVAPGQYKLRATRADPNPEVATVPIVVDGADLTVTLTGSSGGTVSGHVVADEGVTAAIPRAQISIAEPVLGQPEALGAFQGRYTPVVPSPADGSFTVKNVFGPALIEVTVPDGWMVKQVTHEGADITSTPVQLKNGEQLSNVRVVLTNVVTTISGRLVVDDKGTPTTDGTVVVFAADSEKWTERSPLVRVTRPDQQGRYEIKGLPAGEYLAVAVDYIEEYADPFDPRGGRAGAWNDPDYLEGLRRVARKITLAAGKTETLTLVVTPAP